MPTVSVPSRFGADPFVGFGVLQIGRNVHGGSYGGGWVVYRTGAVFIPREHLPLRTNGSFTTLAARFLSRISTCTVSPRPYRPSARGATRDSACCIRRAEAVPLVIFAGGVAASHDDLRCARSIPASFFFPRRIRPTNWAFWPMACQRPALPMKSRGETQVHGPRECRRRAASRDRPSPGRRDHAGLQAQRVARAEPGGRDARPPRAACATTLSARAAGGAISKPSSPV